MCTSKDPSSQLESFLFCSKALLYFSNGPFSRDVRDIQSEKSEVKRLK